MSAVLPLAPAAALPAGRTPHVRQARRRQGFAFGKYREIIIAVAFFLLFDLGVLILNFYTSFQIAEDALGVNLSGRQRMLSQRMTKSLLSVANVRAMGQAAGPELDELRGAVKLFDVSLKGFQQGATVPGGDGKPVFLRAADGEKIAQILKKAQDIWTPYRQALSPVLDSAAGDAEMQSAVDYARGNNLKLLALMTDLTTALESVASARASNLRAVQTGGIVLALLNFAFIWARPCSACRRRWKTRPGFSTADGVSMHAGRGVGLDLVQANVRKLGARVLLSSSPGQFTEFKIKFAG